MDCAAGLEIGGLSLYVDINKGLKKRKTGIKPWSRRSACLKTSNVKKKHSKLF
jgi:hypothetical protein